MDWENITIGFLFQKGGGRSNQRNPMIYLTHKWVYMTNQLFVVVGVVAEVVVRVVARVVTSVGVELRLRLWKLDAVDDVRVQRYLASGDGNLCLHLHAVLRCFSSPGVATPSDGALRRHPHTLTALRTESGVEDASGERGLCVCGEDGGAAAREHH